MQPNITMPAAHLSYCFLQLAPNSASPVTQFGNVPTTTTVLPAAVHITVDVEGPSDLPPTATSNNMESTQQNITMPAAHLSYLFCN